MMVIYDAKRLYLESRGYCTLEECRGINIEFFEKTVSQEIQRANKHFNNNIARVRVRSVKRLKRERENHLPLKMITITGAPRRKEAS